MNMNMLKRRAELTREIRELETRLKSLKATAVELDADILADMTERGVRSQRAHGFQFIAATRTFARVPADKMSTMIERLREAGMDDMVVPTISISDLNGLVREWKDEAEAAGIIADPVDAVPEQFRDCVSVAEVTRLQVRKA